MFHNPCLISLVPISKLRCHFMNWYWYWWWWINKY